ncbi:MAG TPA: lasso peptide biosynthesis B2 protein [Pyrinomonadaceae bacterium]|nr:lasso peptide biosynthesis B2 protein [Pyrinomonadaceae bacterium]
MNSERLLAAITVRVERKIERILAASIKFALESFESLLHFDEDLTMLRNVSRAVKLIGSRPARAILLLRMGLWVAILSLVVKLCSLPRALRIISTSYSGKQSNGAGSEQELATAIDAVLGLNFLMFRPICWKRAAILHRFLSVRGKATRINFGLRKGASGALDGHAWLEADGHPILESGSSDYTVTYVFPSTAECKVDLTSLAKIVIEQHDSTEPTS